MSNGQSKKTKERSSDQALISELLQFVQPVLGHPVYRTGLLLICCLAFSWLLLPRVDLPSVRTVLLLVAALLLVLVLAIVLAIALVWVYRMRLERSVASQKLRRLFFGSLLVFITCAVPTMLAAVPPDTTVPLLRSLASLSLPNTIVYLSVTVTYVALALMVFWWALLFAVTDQLAQLRKAVEPFEANAFMDTVIDSFRRMQPVKPTAVTSSVDSLRRIKGGKFEVVVCLMWRIKSKDAKEEPVIAFREKCYVVKADRDGKILSFEEQPKES